MNDRIKEVDKLEFELRKVRAAAALGEEEYLAALRDYAVKATVTFVVGESVRLTFHEHWLGAVPIRAWFDDALPRTPTARAKPPKRHKKDRWS